MEIEHYKSTYWSEQSSGIPTPFTPQQALDEIHGMCGCAGKYDCDCVSVVNKVHVKLWTEANLSRLGKAT